MRDLIDDPHPDYTATMMADLTGRDRPVAGLGGAVEPEVGGKATQVHAGASEGAERGPEEVQEIPMLPGGLIGELGHCDVGLSSPNGMLAYHDVPQTFAEACRVFAAADRILAAVPSILLAGTEPWAESDEAYWARLLAHAPFLDHDDWRELNAGVALDDIGFDVRCPRPRLVRVET